MNYMVFDRLRGIRSKELEMETQNLDIYGHEPILWSRALQQLEVQTREEGRTCWLATAGPDGVPHLAAVGAVWIDDKFYFTSGPRTRKSRNIASNANCAISVSLDDIDIVVEGPVHKVTDAATLERVANVYASIGWPARASGGAITAEFSAPSAGRGPWDLYSVAPTAAVGVATKEPHGATRWRF
jgi:pyridoxine/pyridoxamine 5'-phosphate oxidase